MVKKAAFYGGVRCYLALQCHLALRRRFDCERDADFGTLCVYAVNIRVAGGRWRSLHMAVTSRTTSPTPILGLAGTATATGWFCLFGDFINFIDFINFTHCLRVK